MELCEICNVKYENKQIHKKSHMHRTLVKTMKNYCKLPGIYYGKLETQKLLYFDKHTK
jgi:hypothetical protein